MADAQQEIAQTGGYTVAASSIAGLTNIFSGFAETSSFKAELKARTNAAILNAGNAVTSYELQQVKNKEQIDNLNHVLGDKLSERGLNALKEASMLKTAAAETGTVGGTTDEAIKEAFINENMDKANIISSTRQQRKNILISMETAELGIEHKIDSILLGGIVDVDTNLAVAGIAGGLNVLTQTLGMLPSSSKADIFNKD